MKSENKIKNKIYVFLKNISFSNKITQKYITSKASVELTEKNNVSTLKISGDMVKANLQKDLSDFWESLSNITAKKLLINAKDINVIDESGEGFLIAVIGFCRLLSVEYELIKNKKINLNI